MSEIPLCPGCNQPLVSFSAHDRQALALAHNFPWVCPRCLAVRDESGALISITSVKEQERSYFLDIINTFKAVNAPTTLRQIGEGLRAGFAAGSPTRYAWADVGPEVLRALWEAMERIGGAIPSAPEVLTTKRSISRGGDEEAYIRKVLDAINDVVRWCEAKRPPDTGTAPQDAGTLPVKWTGTGGLPTGSQAAGASMGFQPFPSASRPAGQEGRCMADSPFIDIANRYRHWWEQTLQHLQREDHTGEDFGLGFEKATVTEDTGDGSERVIATTDGVHDYQHLVQIAYEYVSKLVTDNGLTLELEPPPSRFMDFAEARRWGDRYHQQLANRGHRGNGTAAGTLAAQPAPVTAETCPSRRHGRHRTIKARIPSGESLLGLSLHSLRLVQLIRDHLPVTPEILPPIPLDRSEGFSAYSNAVWAAHAAVKCAGEADATADNVFIHMQLKGWPTSVFPAWKRTTTALGTILDHYGWTSLRGAEGITIFSEGVTAAVNGEVRPMEQVLAPGNAAICQMRSGPPIPTRLLDLLEHCASILHREVSSCLANEFNDRPDASPDLGQHISEAASNATVGTNTPDESTALPTIWYHGERSYSTDGYNPKVATGEQHNLLQAFLDKDAALDTKALSNKGVCNVAAVINKLVKRFGEGPIRRPVDKGDGYFIRVRSLQPTK